MPGVGGGEDAGGYAKALTPEQLKEQQKLVREHLVDSDLVVTTALVPGRKAPTLIPADVVKDMKPGAVIVDLAVAQGGNCELSEPGKTVEVNGVKILGEVNMPGLLAADASAVYARNVLALVTDMMAAAGMPPGNYTLGGQSVTTDGRSVRLPDGTLAGSVLLMDQAIRNVAQWASLGPAQAIRMATEVPANLIHRDDIGRLRPGAVADLVVLDANLRVQRTIIDGFTAFSAS